MTEADAIEGHTGLLLDEILLDHCEALHRRFDELVPNAVSDLLDQIDAESFLDVLRSRPPHDVLKCLQDLRAPAQSLTRTSADRARKALRRAPAHRRQRALTFLFGPISHDTVSWVGPGRGPRTVLAGESLVDEDGLQTLSSSREKWGASAVAVAKLSHPIHKVDLAMLLLEPEYLPSTWPTADSELLRHRDAASARLEETCAFAAEEISKNNEGAYEQAQEEEAGTASRTAIEPTAGPARLAIASAIVAADPAAARDRATQARRRGGEREDAEARLWDHLAELADLAARTTPLALAALAHDRERFEGVPPLERDALEALLEGDNGEEVRSLLAEMLAHQQAGDSAGLMGTMLRLGSIAPTIPGSVLAASRGDIRIEAPAAVDPIVEMLATQSLFGAIDGSEGMGGTGTTAPAALSGEQSEPAPADRPPPEATARETEPTVPPDDPETAPDQRPPATDPTDEETVTNPRSPSAGNLEEDGESGSPVESAVTTSDPERARDSDQVLDEATEHAEPVGDPAEGTEPAHADPSTAVGDDVSRELATSDGADVEGPAPGQDAVPANASGLDVDAARAALIKHLCWGGIATLDRQLDHPTAAWEAAAVAQSMRAPFGELSKHFTDIVGDVQPRTVNDRPGQVVGLLAAIRAAFISPSAGSTVALQALAPVIEADMPGLANMARSALRATASQLLYSSSVGDVADAADQEAALDAVAAEAQALLERPGRSSFQRSSYIWENWVASNGALEQLLGPIIRQRVEELEQVRTWYDRLSHRRGPDGLVDETDDLLRSSPNRNRIDGIARRKLIKAIDDAVRIAATWLGEVTATTARQQPTLDRRAAQLRDAFATALPAARNELEALEASANPILAAAGSAASALLDPVVNLVINGRPLAGQEPGIEVALRGDLLRAASPLNDDLSVERKLTPSEAIDLTTTTLEDALERRLSARQFGLVLRLVDEMDRLGQDSAQRRHRLNQLLAVANSEVAAHVTSARQLITSAQRFGRIDAEAADGLSVRLDALLTSRMDFDRVDLELDAIHWELDVEAERSRTTFLASLEAVEAGDGDLVRPIRPRIDGLLAASPPDIAAAEDLLQRALDGEDLTIRQEESRSLLDPATIDGLQDGVTEGLIDACASRSADALDFSGLSPEASDQSAEALRAWHAVAGKKWSSSPFHVLAPVLQLLDLAGGKERNRAGYSLRGHDFHRFDLVETRRQGSALVPQFGTYTAGLYAFALVWGKPSVETMLSWTSQDPREGQATIVLHFGTLPLERRIELANRSRSSSERPIIVVDDAVIAHLAAIGRSRFEDLMRATLPYACVNPFYIGGGDVPVEMFYGRIDERRDVMEKSERTLIYGGRRLGKSALLRSAKARFEDGGNNRKAILVNLDEGGIGQHRRPAAVWDLLVPELVASGVGKAGRRREDPDKLGPRLIREWLDTDRTRRLLVLLDEADEFFDADSEAGFVQTRLFRTLKEETQQRFKPVFAGLHQVARFAQHHNQPFAQLVTEEAPIGPLPAGPAHDLLVTPLEAMGWRFETDELIDQVLHACNYIPILIQEFGRDLMKRLISQPLLPGTTFSYITRTDVDAILTTSDFEKQARSRIEVTLELDPRYKVVAWSVHLGLINGLLTTDALYDECRDLWPAGFERTGFAEFRSLVNELVHLGILAGRVDRERSLRTWRIRGHNVANLLGKESDVTKLLEELVRTDPPVGSFFGAGTRREINESDEIKQLSPLTEGQLTDVVGLGRTQVRVVVGTKATGVQNVARAIDAVNRNVQNGCEVTRVKRSSGLKAALRKATSGHQVIVDDLAVNQVGADGVRAAVREAMDAPEPSATGGSRSVVLIIGAAQYFSIVRMLDDAPGNFDLEVVGCERFDVSGLRAYTLTDQGFASPADRQTVISATGGWPCLVDKLVAEARAQTTAVAADSIRRQNETPDGARELVESTGVDTPPLREALQTLVQLVDNSNAAAKPDELAGFLDDEGISDDAASIVKALRGIGALAEVSGMLYVEPILATALLAYLPPSARRERDPG